MGANIYWFSGTGNSWLVASRIASRLEEGGMESRIFALEALPPPKFRLAASRAWFKAGNEGLAFGAEGAEDRDGLDIFCFPIFAFSEPAFVDRFVKRLPVSIGAGGGRRAAAVATMGGGGYEGRALARVARILRESGRRVVLTEAVEMPEAFVQAYPATPPEEAEARTAAGLAAADKLAAKLLAGEASIRKAKPAGVAATWLVSVLYKALGRRLLGLTWSASPACTGCGLCAARCPAGTIRMLGGTPHWGPACEGCQRCANICPAGAVRISIPRLLFMAAPLFMPWGRWMASLAGIRASGGERFLLWLAGFLAANAVIGLLLWLADLVPGPRRIRSASHAGGFRRRLAPGFAAELSRIREPRRKGPPD